MAALISSDSSSDEEEKLRLQDAVVDQTLFHQKEDPKNSKMPSHSQKPSLRRQDDEEEETGDYRSIQATKGFKVHVAKKLAAVLDSSIIEITDEDKRKKKPKQRQINDNNSTTGFMLFSTSDMTNTTHSDPQNWEREWNKTRKREIAQCSSSDSDREDERLLEARVTQADVFEMGQRESLYDESKKTKGHCETIVNGQSEMSQKRKRNKKKKHKHEGSEEIELNNVQSKDNSKFDETIKSHHGNNCKKKKKKNKRDNMDKECAAH
ncbi:uncharacterized protein LOC144449508 [Glandiceps talaboti]